MFSCNDSSKKVPQKRFYIIGNTDNITNKTKVVLKTQENNTIITLDSTLVRNGIFEFEGEIDKPSVYGIYIDSLKNSIGFFIENDSIIIDVNKNNLSDSKINGSKLNNQYLNYIKSSNQIISKTNLLYPIFQKARAENNVERLNKINEKMEAINAENILFTLNYAKKHPNSYIAAFALHSVLNDSSISKDSIFSIYNSFSDEVKAGDFAIATLIFIETESILDTIKN